MQLKEINLNVFQNFAANHALYNFYQSRGMADSQTMRGVENFSLGLFDTNNNIIAATLCFVSVNRKFIRTMNVNYGFLIDYENQDVFSSFMQHFIQFCRKKRISKIKINPYIIGFIYDQETPRKIDNSRIENLFKQFNFIQVKPVVDYTQLVNLMFVKNLAEFKTFTDITKSFQPNLQRLIKKALEFDIEVSPITNADEVERYYKIECASAEKNNTSARDFSYYQSIYQSYAPLDEVLFLIATLDIDKYRRGKEQKKSEIQANIKKINAKSPLSKKMKNRLRAEQEILDGINNRLKDIEDITATGVLDIGGCLAFKNSKEIIVLEMGQYEEFERFSPTSVIYFKLMQYAFEHNISRFNFYGTYGINDPASKGYNIYQYKKRFGGALEQLIPAFELDLNFLAKFI